MIHTDARLAAILGAVIGGPVVITRRAPLSGGSINRVERITTDHGTFVVKSHAAAPAAFFRAEAAGLEALRASGASLRVPYVVACDDEAGVLILGDLGEGRRGPAFDEQIGRGLAMLHRAGHTRFGFAHDNYCGLTPQRNPWTDRWVEFFGAWRLGVQVQMARDGGRLSRDEAAHVDRVIAGLDRWITDPPEGPVLIHGDLWSGNLHVADDGRPALIDPAASYSHREAELGMMTLFGGFPTRAFAAYDEAFPLEPGWRDRNPIYQLYHLLNHLNLFGGSYRSGVMNIVVKFTMGT